ncbi:MAG: isoprenylcysteine carboxylmethyltransferase family protein [Betaproteobacteria bacterium]|nr:isoprenylcysteine carboxylmethyltransferase family protein [Betaproteobacteria bacterium]
MRALIPPPVVAAILAAAMWLTQRVFAFANVSAPWLAPTAAVMLIAGVMLFIAAGVSFMRARTTINPMKPANASALITTGIFALSRNPIYLADLLLLAAFALWLGNVINIVFLPAFVWYIKRFQIAPEEDALRALFGDAYAAYCAKVRRWL